MRESYTAITSPSDTYTGLHHDGIHTAIHDAAHNLIQKDLHKAKQEKPETLHNQQLQKVNWEFSVCQWSMHELNKE